MSPLSPGSETNGPSTELSVCLFPEPPPAPPRAGSVPGKRQAEECGHKLRVTVETRVQRSLQAPAGAAFEEASRHTRATAWLGALGRRRPHKGPGPELGPWRLRGRSCRLDSAQRLGAGPASPGNQKRFLRQSSRAVPPWLTPKCPRGSLRNPPALTDSPNPRHADLQTYRLWLPTRRGCSLSQAPCAHAGNPPPPPAPWASHKKTKPTKDSQGGERQGGRF